MQHCAEPCCTTFAPSLWCPVWSVGIAQREGKYRWTPGPRVMVSDTSAAKFKATTEVVSDLVPNEVQAAAARHPFHQVDDNFSEFLPVWPKLGNIRASGYNILLWRAGRLRGRCKRHRHGLGQYEQATTENTPSAVNTPEETAASRKCCSVS